MFVGGPDWEKTNIWFNTFINMDISVLKFYEYIKNIKEILMDIFYKHKLFKINENT